VNRWFHEAGLTGSQIVSYDAGCPSPPIASPSDIAQAVQKFKTSGVTNVTGVYFMGRFSIFTIVAERQGFRPKYGIADDGCLPTSAGTGEADPNNLDGAIAITPARLGEQRTPGMTPSPGTAKCNEIFRSHGLTPVYQQPTGWNGGLVCDLVWMFKAAVDHAPTLSRQALAAGLQAAKSIDSSFPAGHEERLLREQGHLRRAILAGRPLPTRRPLLDSSRSDVLPTHP
jgi:hypothetical protein